MNYRPEYEHRWGSKTATRQLRLDPLPAESAGELLAALLGAGSRARAAQRRCWWSAGNPFFLEETVRTLVETGALAGERGAYRLTRPVEALQVPATVQAILAARIDRLPPEDKRLLQAASVIGKDVPYALLQAIAEQPEEALRRGLAASAGGGVPLRDAASSRTSSTPSSTRSPTRWPTAACSQERRRALHAQIVAAIERLYARPAGRAGRAARPPRAARASCGTRRVAYLPTGRRQGGRRARPTGRRSTYFEQALTALGASAREP